MKLKFIWVGFIVFLISWGGNLIYFQSQQLEEPIFLDHYYEPFVDNDWGLTFYYLSNKRDTSTASYVTIDGEIMYPETYPSSFFFFSNQTVPYYKEEYRHHYLKSLTISNFNDVIAHHVNEEGVWIFEEITVHFDDGRSVNANIGEVRIRERRTEPSVLHARSGSSGSTHWEQTMMYAEQPITIEEIQVPFNLLHQGVVGKVKVDNPQMDMILNQEVQAPAWLNSYDFDEWNNFNGIHITNIAYPFSLAEGERLQTFWQFRPDRYAYYQFGMKIKGTTAAGEPFADIDPIIDHPSLSQADIDHIIEVKGGDK
ncbi:hypothetical protein [Longirhabdus pacifica]|uniref:hypothetical protein n=1 Tax=Longirhabdus pacifica TaxID=2305227 RepID=UPI001008D1D1|nr:hypothetical protein [Longirhabdus pacifica]